MTTRERLDNLKSQVSFLQSRVEDITASIDAKIEQRERILTRLTEVSAEVEKLESELKEQPEMV